MLCCSKALMAVWVAVGEVCGPGRPADGHGLQSHDRAVPHGRGMLRLPRHNGGAATQA